MPNTISTACDFNHLIHPLSMPKEKSAPGIWRRISGVALLLLSIPFTLGILTGLYLYWAHKKVVQIKKEQTQAIDATVQKLFGKQVGGQPNAQFVHTVSSLYKGRTGEAFKQMKKLNTDNLLTDEAKSALAESAIERNQLNLIESILNEFNDIDVPLHKAKTGAMVNKLIELGTDPNTAVDKDGSTALHYAANLEVVKALKAKHAEIYYNDQGLTPLHTCKNPEVALFLLAPEPDGYNMNVNQLDRNGNPPLFTVGNPEILQLLIERGANVRFINGYGSCILHMNHPLPENLLNLVLEKANETEEPSLLNCKDKLGHTPLFRSSSDEWKRLLIDKGANINDCDDEGNTLLHRCSTKAFAEFLIEKGIPLQAKNNSGDTPLHVAGTEEVANFLLDQGANINALDTDGRSPLISNPQPWLKKLLINRGADLAIKDKWQQTILHHSVDDPEIVKTLLAKEGVDPNAVNSRGKTALIEALGSWVPQETIKNVSRKIGSQDSRR